MCYSDRPRCPMGWSGGMLSNNALDRTVNHRGRAVLAMNCVLAGAEWQRWPAGHQDR